MENRAYRQLFVAVFFILIYNQTYGIEGRNLLKPTSTKIEIEGNFQIVNEEGINPIEVFKDPMYDDGSGKAVTLFDVGDEIKISFNIATAGKYQIKVRLRSGQIEEPQRYWPNGYRFSIDGNTTPFSGDPNSISAYQGKYWGAYWGTMVSENLDLSSGDHEVFIKTNQKWAGVDFIEIMEVENSQVVLEHIPDQVNFVNDTVSLQIKVINPDNLPLVFSTETDYTPNEDLPPGLTLNTKTGLISGTILGVGFRSSEISGVTIKVRVGSEPVKLIKQTFRWEIKTRETPSLLKYEFEDYFTIKKDLGQNGNIGLIEEYIYNDQSGIGISLFDKGDRLHLGFRISEDGNYSIKVKLRSGDLSNSTKYWDSGYQFMIDGVYVPFKGNINTLSDLQTGLGGSYWGMMESPILLLKEGYYYIEIQAEHSWGAVDYIEIEESVEKGENLYLEKRIPNLDGSDLKYAKWIDFDKDGDLDLINCKPNSNKINLLLNNNGQFTVATISLDVGESFLIESIDIRDFDSDEDFDFLIYGIGLGEYNYDNHALVRVFQNNNKIYEEIETGLAVQGSYEYNWLDSDQDGDLDILGRDHFIQDSFDFNLRFEKDKNIFAQYVSTETKSGIGLGSWIDFNRDGLKDFLQHGFSRNFNEPYTWTRVYKHTSFGVFEDIEANLPDRLYGEWYDFDEDGDFDIRAGTYFINDGQENFRGSGIKAPIYPESINGITNVITTLDFNHDGHLDFFTSDGKLFLNTSKTIKHKPDIPTGLKAVPNSNSVLLTWNDVKKGSEEYNLYVRKGNETVFTSESNRTTGYPFVNHNNVGVSPIFRVQNLKPGTYQWSVQTVGDGQLASKFAPESSFTIDESIFPCSIEKVELGEHKCNPYNGFFDQEIKIFFKNPPIGSFIINEKEYEVTGNPTIVKFQSLGPDIDPIDLFIYFKNNPDCKIEVLNFIVAPNCFDCNHDRVLITQEQVNNFNCTTLNGDLVIQGNDIIDLSPLSNLNSVKGELRITSNNKLKSLSGLENLIEVNNLVIGYHPLLVSIEELKNLSKINNLEVKHNKVLNNCCGINKLIRVATGTVNILNNKTGCNSANEITTICPDPPQPGLFEAEENYKLVKDIGEKGTVEEFNESIYSNGTGKAVSIFDIGDRFKISFTVEESASYKLIVRLRSGGTTTKNAYWPDGYQFSLNNIPLKLEGDPSTVSSFQETFGGSYWGDMVSDDINLENGIEYSLEIESAKDWAAIDYLLVEKVGSSISNRPPSALFLDNLTIKENQDIPALVGSFSATDPDFFEKFTYNFISGAGDEHNSYFQIKGSQLQSNKVFDFEEENELSIRVEVKDSKGEGLQRIFEIEILDVKETAENQPPNDILLDNSGVEEEKAVGTLIGILSAIDPDTLDNHTFSFVSGEGDTDNSQFKIENDLLKSAAIFDFETKNTLSIRINVKDNSGGEFEKKFIITVIDQVEKIENNPPTDIQLSKDEIPENALIGTIVGDFSAIDVDSEDLHSFGLVKGEGDIDNNNFSIAGNSLKANQIFDYENKKKQSIRVQVTDGNGGTFEKIFEIKIIDLEENVGNSSPTDILLSAVIVEENKEIGTVIGTFSTEDVDSLDVHSYMILKDYGGDQYFKVDGKMLVSNEVFDFETQEKYKIKVQVGDGNGGVFSKEFTITILDIEEVTANQSPVDIQLSNVNIVENAPVGTLVGKLTSSDPDEFDNHTYKFVEGEGDTDNDKFFILGNELFSGGIFNYEDQKLFSVRIEANDGNEGTYEEAFNIFLTKTEIGYSIGGILFQRNGNRVKHGKALLLQKQNDDSFAEYQNQTLTNSDLFVFTDVPEGEYIIKAIPEKKFYPSLIDTYSGDNIIMAESQEIKLRSDSLNQNIIIQAIASVVGGSGEVRGKVITGSNFLQRFEGEPLSNVQLYIQQSNIKEVIAETISDEDGNFTFEDLSVNKYRILVDYLAIPLSLIGLSTEITESNETVDVTVIVNDNEIILGDNALTGLSSENSLQGILNYPNPVSTTLNVLIENNVNGKYHLRVCNVLGKTIIEDYINKSGKSFFYTMKFQNQPKGIYFLIVENNGLVFKNKIMKVD